MATPRSAESFVFPITNNRSPCRRNSVSLCETIEYEIPDGHVEAIVDAIHEMFPPEGLDQRIALSRKDGYWPFIRNGEDPPQEFVYGEFDIVFLKQSLEKARELLGKDDEDIVFCDLGSGTGRLVLATAALHPAWKLCRGIELLESIHEEALEKMESCQQQTNEEIEEDKESSSEGINGNARANLSLNSTIGPIPLAPIELECGSFSDPYSSFCDANILFCFSSCLPREKLIDLARSIGRQSVPGTIVITTEYQLPTGGPLDPLPDDPEYPYGEYKFELLDSFSGDCTAVGGISTVYIQRVVESLGTGERRVQPPIPLSELAYRAIKYMEEADTDIFLRQVSNNMVFLGLPESWRPKV